MLRQLDAASWIGLVLVGLFVVAAVFAPWIEPHDPQAQDIARRLKPPGYFDVKIGANFWLGTDGLCRDVLSRLIEGERVSLLVGVGGERLSALLGTSLGLTAGYGGGWWDSVIMRVV